MHRLAPCKLYGVFIEVWHTGHFENQAESSAAT